MGVFNVRRCKNLKFSPKPSLGRVGLVTNTNSTELIFVSYKLYKLYFVSIWIYVYICF